MFEFFRKEYITKEETLLRILQKNVNKPVSALTLCIKAKTLHHTELIRKLRARGFKIVNTCKNIKREKHSFYTLVEIND